MARLPHQLGATKQRLLDAAETLARRLGPGHLSLEAVAAEAGVSKGGLLYHFPSKAALLEALVGQHLSRLDDALRAREGTGPNATISAYVDQFVQECARQRPPASGLLAALAENPQLLEPVRAQERDFLHRVRADAGDADFATIAFLVIHALRAMKMLGTNVLDEDDTGKVIAWLRNALRNRPD